MNSQKRFLESAKVHDHYYGTPKLWVEGKLRKGKDVLLVIDVQGGRAIRRQKKCCLLIFIMPPNLCVLKKRLLGRHSDEPAATKVRLKNAREEITAGRRYDYRVVNDKLNQAVLDVARIIRRERQKS